MLSTARKKLGIGPGAASHSSATITWRSPRFEDLDPENIDLVAVAGMVTRTSSVVPDLEATYNMRVWWFRGCTRRQR